MNDNNNRDNLIQGQQANAASVGTKFRTQRFLLDVARDRFTHGVTDHTFGSGIKSFWVSDTNNTNFVAKIVPNFKGDRQKESGLPLRFNMNQKFTTPVNDACLEFAAQAGVWVEISYSESEDISIGNTDVELSGAVSANEGATYTSTKMTAAASVAELLPADSARFKAILQHKSGGSIWIGSQTDLADADFKNICQELPAGSNVEWWNRGALYFKSDVASVFARMIFKA